MSHAKEHQTDELLKRLNKIEGQVSGIKKMVVANKDYGDIMIQLNSARSAIQKISQILLEAQADHALMHVSEGFGGRNEGLETGDHPIQQVELSDRI